MHPLEHASTNVASAGFEGDRRGELYVQFKDKDGQPTTLGYYRDVPRALFNALVGDRKPGQFIHRQLKERFEWVAVSRAEGEEAEEPGPGPAPPGILIWPLPDELFYGDGCLFPASSADDTDETYIAKYVESVNEQIRRKVPHLIPKTVNLFG